MRGKIVTKLVVAIIAISFVLGASMAFAAQQWCLDKNSKGVCSVRECPKGKTKTTIEGPFATKAEAEKAKANSKDCLKKPEKKPEKTPAPK